MYAEFRNRLVIVVDSVLSCRELLDKAALLTQALHWNTFAFWLYKLDPESGCTKDMSGFALQGLYVEKQRRWTSALECCISLQRLATLNAPWITNSLTLRSLGGTHEFHFNRFQSKMT